MKNIIKMLDESFDAVLLNAYHYYKIDHDNLMVHIWEKDHWRNIEEQYFPISERAYHYDNQNWITEKQMHVELLNKQMKKHLNV